jgi:hypothetical protein
MTVKPSSRALPFAGKSIRFGELCVVVGNVKADAYSPHVAYETTYDFDTYIYTDQVISSGTLIVPLRCFTDNWMTVTECLTGEGLVFISSEAIVERL